MPSLDLSSLKAKLGLSEPAEPGPSKPQEKPTDTQQRAAPSIVTVQCWGTPHDVSHRPPIGK